MDERTCKENTKMLIEVVERCKSNTHRIDNIEKTQNILHEMNGNIKVLAEQTKTQGDEIKSIKKDVTDIKSKPGKRWDIVITTIITVIVTVMVTYLISK